MQGISVWQSDALVAWWLEDNSTMHKGPMPGVTATCYWWWYGGLLVLYWWSTTWWSSNRERLCYQTDCVLVFCSQKWFSKTIYKTFFKSKKIKTVSNKQLVFELTCKIENILSISHHHKGITLKSSSIFVKIADWKILAYAKWKIWYYMENYKL